MKKASITCSLLLMSSSMIVAQEHSPSPTRSGTPAPTRPSTQVNPGNWVRLNPEEGRFSVLMPELPKDQAETKQSPNGPYTTHLFLARTPQGIFLVGWVDYAPSFNFGIQSELQANRDNFVKGVKATLLTTKQITMDGHPGLEFTAETEQVFFKSRVYLVGRRPYQLIAGTFRGQEDAANVSKFFDSFEVER